MALQANPTGARQCGSKSRPQPTCPHNRAPEIMPFCRPPACVKVLRLLQAPSHSQKYGNIDLPATTRPWRRVRSTAVHACRTRRRRARPAHILGSARSCPDPKSQGETMAVPVCTTVRATANLRPSPSGSGMISSPSDTRGRPSDSLCGPDALGRRRGCVPSPDLRCCRPCSVPRFRVLAVLGPPRSSHHSAP